jgi:toxin ParE1/3/4
MGQVIKRPAALQDLQDLAVFIGQRNPRAAQRFLDAAEETFQQLADMPGMGSPTAVADPSFAGMRMFPVRRFPRYVILYLPLPNGIDVVRVVHSSRDWMAFFGGPA